jgi:hypothetical protein
MKKFPKYHGYIIIVTYDVGGFIKPERRHDIQFTPGEDWSEFQRRKRLFGDYYYFKLNWNPQQDCYIPQTIKWDGSLNKGPYWIPMKMDKNLEAINSHKVQHGANYYCSIWKNPPTGLNYTFSALGKHRVILENMKEVDNFLNLLEIR